ncbi:MAG: hypothetical protein KGK15_16680 [Burkholderiales bacterium]|nr:hypothetical protein [Burkholderiales bacterium]
MKRHRINDKSPSIAESAFAPPAKVVRELTEAEIDGLSESAADYARRANAYRNELDVIEI